MTKLKPFLPPHVMLLFYSTLICPYLHYCILALGKSSIPLMDKVNVVQKRAVRIINNFDFLAHKNRLFDNCNIL